MATNGHDDDSGAALAPGAVARLWDHCWRQMAGITTTRMAPRSMLVDGRRVRYAVSDNTAAHGPGGPGTPPVWAINVHGYFTGGGMYWRESSLLADALGWRVIAPSLPGFGGSDPLPPDRVTLGELGDHVQRVLDDVGAGPAVVLGHSMGAAVAIEHAHRHPGTTLGLICRDAVATPAWTSRRGPLPALLSAISPDMALFTDLWAAAMLDVPDLLVGRLYSTIRSMVPDFGLSVWSAAHTLPVARVLMDVDLTTELGELARAGMPILAEWGCFDRVVTADAAWEFSECANTPIQWLPGGHSWMLARPQGQADVLQRMPSGKRFTADVEERWRRLRQRDVGPERETAVASAPR
jgi:pimeloyl-ACP methyl ester carboxylesterase